MKRGSLLISFLFAFILVFLALGFFGLTGNVVDKISDLDGIPEEEGRCMKDCVSVGCEEGDVSCMVANSQGCMDECDVEIKVPEDEGEKCIEKCLDRYCEIGFEYVSCSNSYSGTCEDECGMVKEPDAENEEEKCIMDCVSRKDPDLECESGKSFKEEEQGNSICRECDRQCEYLYSGTCLTDKERKDKEAECDSLGEHVDGEPVYGDSGEGYECVVGLECVDSGSEFGDEPGDGSDNRDDESINSESFVDIAGKVVDFFKGLFDRDDKRASVT